MATLFPLEDVEKGIEKLVNSPFHISSYFLRSEDEARAGLSVYGHALTRPVDSESVYWDEELPDRQFELRLPKLSEHYAGWELHERDTPYIRISAYSEWKDIIGRQNDILLNVDLANNRAWAENFLSAALVEELFKLWPPYFSWFDSHEGLDMVYGVTNLNKPSKRLVEKPWLHFKDAMVFGPELVAEYGLKNVAWGETGCFFHKWLPNDVLWLASPEGARSGGQRLAPSPMPIWHMDSKTKTKLREVAKRHYNALKEHIPSLSLEPHDNWFMD